MTEATAAATSAPLETTSRPFVFSRLHLIVGSEQSRSPRSRRQRVNAAAASVLMTLGAIAALFAVFQLIVTDVSEARSQRALAGELSHRLTAARSLASSGLLATDEVDPEVGEIIASLEIEPGSPVGRLEIPAIGLARVVVEGTSSAQLNQGPGHFRHTPLPGHPGNSVIGGRQATYGEAFAHIDDLDRGDRITITTMDGKFTYQVASVERLQPREADAFGQDDANLLTLVTSAGTGDRIAVTAELEGDPVIDLSRDDQKRVTATSVDQEELGLGRDPEAWLPVMLWGEALIVTYVITRIVYRRWRRRSAWLITTPVVLAVGFVWFEQVSRLLPSTW